MLTYFERAFLLAGVPTMFVERVRLGYLPAAAAVIALGLGLLLSWQVASRRRNLHEAVAGIQMLLFGSTLAALGFSLEATANFLFLVFLFALIASALLALFNFRGMGNISIRELQINRRQAVAYGAVVGAAILVYLVVGMLIPDAARPGSGLPLPLQLSASRAIFGGSGMS